MVTFIVIFLIVLVVLYIAYLLRNGEEDMKQQPAPQPIQFKVEVDAGSDAPVQQLQYFCIKDKGYHVSVWPRDHHQTDIVEFALAGISYCTDIDNYLGEFECTLEEEPDNQYDPNAIKVLAPDGHHVGYVPGDMTAAIRASVALPSPCFVYIGENNGHYFSDAYVIL